MEILRDRKLPRRAEVKVPAFPEDAKEEVDLRESFNKAIDRYWRRKLAGASLTERTRILNGIKEEFQGTNLDLTLIEKELETALSDARKAERELSSSWIYYQKVTIQGAGLPERIEILSQNIQKFAGTGVNLSHVVQELNTMKAQKR